MEFAVLMPLVVLAALIVLQVAFVVRDQVAVVHAAREAARRGLPHQPARGG